MSGPAATMRELIGRNASLANLNAADHRRAARAKGSHLPDDSWMRLEAMMRAVYSRDTGAELFALLRAGEHDFRLFCEVFLGVIPLPWQERAWELLRAKPYLTAELPNAAGKTTAFPLLYSKAIVYRHFAPASWGVYWALHHGPKMEHAERVRSKFAEIVAGTAREQRYRLQGGSLSRPCLLAPFVRAAKQGAYPAFEFFDGAGLLSFRHTAFQAEASDGSDPYFIGEDELRHELYVSHVVEVIFIPRGLRAPGMRMFLPYTSLQASAELTMLHERGKRGHPDWNSLEGTLDELNPTVAEEEKERVRRNVSRRRAVQALTGRSVQPIGAVFSKLAVEAMFVGTEEPDWLDYLGDGCCGCESCETKARGGLRIPLAPVYARASARCTVCQEIARTPTSKAVHPNTEEPDHPLVAAADPASSAAGDAITFTVWDCWPPEELRAAGKFAEVLYIEELEPGTRIQHLVRHASATSVAIRGPVYCDGKSALGRAVGDLAEGQPGDIVLVRWDSREIKDRDIGYAKLLIECGGLVCPYHHRTRIQFIHYVRQDEKKATDFFVVQVLAAHGARALLPDLSDRAIVTESAEAAEIEEELAGLPFLPEGEGDLAYDPFVEIA